MSTPITYRDLAVGLRDLGIAHGAIVEVHSALSAFGWVDGGAQTLIAALIDAVGPNGTLVMSAYPVSRAVPLDDADRARGVTWKVHILANDTLEPTGMGRVADTFRQRPDVMTGRSFFRTCAWGRDAEAHTEGYQRLLADDGWCLLLGVGIQRCSSMHAAEDTPLPADIAAYSEIPEAVRSAYDAQYWNIGYRETPADAWQKIWEIADQQGHIRHANIGSAACHLFQPRALVELYRYWRNTDPYWLYGVPRPA
jgi:aminoglycoside 3-N-acetyltransferase